MFFLFSGKVYMDSVLQTWHNWWILSTDTAPAEKRSSVFSMNNVVHKQWFSLWWSHCYVYTFCTSLPLTSLWTETYIINKRRRKLRLCTCQACIPWGKCAVCCISDSQTNPKTIVWQLFQGQIKMASIFTHHLHALV